MEGSSWPSFRSLATSAITSLFGLKVVGKLVVHHAARDEAALVEVIERFVFAEILVELDNTKLTAALWSLPDWCRGIRVERINEVLIEGGIELLVKTEREVGRGL